MHKDYDFFISHASEDKDALARPLSEALIALGHSVWFDEIALEIGDSLRERINKGLANSTFGVVILSPDFFRKRWPKKELNGMFSLEGSRNEKVILPIWHNISKDEIAQHDPIISDQLALNSAENSIGDIANNLSSLL